MKINKEKVELWLSWLKIGSVLASFLGFLYLFAYCVENKLPMPLSISELPVLLVSVMFLGTVFMFILGGLLAFPMIGRFSLLGKEYTDLFQKSQSMRFKIVFCVPLAVFLISLLLAAFYKQAYSPLIGIVAGAVIAVIYLYFSLKKSQDSNMLKSAIGITLLTLFAAYFWIANVYLIFIAIVSSIAYGYSQAIQLTILIVVAGFLVVGFYFMANPLSSNFDGKQLSLLIIGVLLVVIPLIGQKIGSAAAAYALKMMRIGGAYEAVFIVDHNSIGKISRDLLEETTKEQTKKLQVLLEVGDKMYVRIAPKTQGQKSGTTFIISRSFITGVQN